MTMIDKLLAAYARGEFTPHEAAILFAQRIHAGNVGEVMPRLPRDPHLLPELRRFVQSYQPGRMWINHGEIPSPERVELIKQWFRDHPE